MNTAAGEPSWLREGEGLADVTIEENWLFSLRRERFKSRRSGKIHDFFVIHLADAVNVVAVTPHHNVVLVRQFRAGSSRDSLESPGGLLDPGEDPCEAAARELLEETGYAGDPPTLLGSAYANSSILSSRIFNVVINNCQLVADPKLDPNEEVTVELAPVASIPRMIRDGRIDHALAVMGLLWWISSWPTGALAVPAPSKRHTLSTLMVYLAIICLVLTFLIAPIFPPFVVITAPIILLSIFAYFMFAGRDLFVPRIEIPWRRRTPS